MKHRRIFSSALSLCLTALITLTPAYAGAIAPSVDALPMENSISGAPRLNTGENAADEQSDSAWFIYEVDGGCLYFDPSSGTVSAADHSVRTAVIPGVIDGIAVTRIGAGAFANCGQLTEVELPAGILEIDSRAFEGCVSLVSLRIAPFSEENALPDAEEGETAHLMEALSEPSIRDYAFYGCSSLTCFLIPEAVTAIGYKAFEGCSGLRSIRIPQNVRTIGEDAFRGCTGLEYVVFPVSLNQIGRNAFSGCDAIDAVYFAGNQTAWEALSPNTGLEDKDIVCGYRQVAITDNPSSVIVGKAGDNATTSVAAVGTGLHYQWYSKTPEQTSFVLSGTDSPSFSCSMTAAVSGLQLYCIVSDALNDSVKSETVTFSITSGVKITSQPSNVIVDNAGDVATVSVTATGDGLMYQWYVKESAGSSFSKSGITEPSYSAAMTVANSGRQVYCIVTDQFGNSVQSITATLSLAHHFSTVWNSDTTHHWHDCTDLGCSEVSGKAVHTWDEGAVTTAPVCETDGVKIFSCTVCGQKKTEIIPKLTHTYSLTKTNAKAATCEAAGNITYWTCSGCGKLFSDAAGTTEITAAETVIAATGHSWGTPGYTWNSSNSQVTASRVCSKDSSHVDAETVNATSAISKAATCTAKGEHTYTAAFTKSGFTTQTKTVEDIDALGHAWGEWTVTTAATEDAEGVETRTCSRDTSHKETRSIPKLTHMHVLVKTDAVASTCTTLGNAEYWTCSSCGKHFSDNGGVTEIDLSETVLPMISHDWSEWTVTVPATEKSDGLETRNCLKCDESETRAIPRLTHSHHLVKTTAKAPTCEEAGNINYWSCSGCGKVFDNAAGTSEINSEDTVISALGHDWNEWTETTPATENSTGVETRICKRDASHIETRTIPKLQFELKASVSGTTLTWSATLPNKNETVYVFAAWYSKNGQMLGVKADTVVSAGATGNQTIDVGEGAATYKLFILDKQYRPIMKCWSSD